MNIFFIGKNLPSEHFATLYIPFYVFVYFFVFFFYINDTWKMKVSIGKKKKSI